MNLSLETTARSTEDFIFTRRRLTRVLICECSSRHHLSGIGHIGIAIAFNVCNPPRGAAQRSPRIPCGVRGSHRFVHTGFAADARQLHGGRTRSRVRLDSDTWVLIRCDSCSRARIDWLLPECACLTPRPPLHARSPLREFRAPCGDVKRLSTIAGQGNDLDADIGARCPLMRSLAFRTHLSGRTFRWMERDLAA